MAVTALRLVDGGAPKATPRPGQRPWECRVCEADIGVRSRVLVRVRAGAMQDRKLRITGGEDGWACAMCLARGRYTPATA